MNNAKFRLDFWKIKIIMVAGVILNGLPLLKGGGPRSGGGFLCDV
jgi:hypothetical protein